MKPTPAQIIAPHLAPGEQVRWTGMSSLRTVLPAGLLRLTFGLAFAASPALALHPGQSPILYLVWVGFLYGGLKIAYDALVGIVSFDRTAFAVTDRRALVVRAATRTRVRSFPPASINILDYHVEKDGSGSIVFRTEESGGGEAPGVDRIGFHGVRNVVGAHTALARLRFEHDAARPGKP